MQSRRIVYYFRPLSVNRQHIEWHKPSIFALFVSIVQSRTSLEGVLVLPLERERPALVRLDWVDSAEIVGGQVNA